MRLSKFLNQLFINSYYHQSIEKGRFSIDELNIIPSLTKIDIF